MDENKEMKIIERIIEKNKKEDFKLGKILGKGGFGLVVEIKIKDKVYAGKLIKKKDGEGIDEADLILNLRGPGIVKVNTIHSQRGNFYLSFNCDGKSSFKKFKQFKLSHTLQKYV